MQQPANATRTAGKQKEDNGDRLQHRSTWAQSSSDSTCSGADAAAPNLCGGAGRALSAVGSVGPEAKGRGAPHSVGVELPQPECPPPFLSRL